MITIFLVMLILVLVVYNIIIKHKYRVLQVELDETHSDVIYYRSMLSMIECNHRKFKEGQNPYTTMRSIDNILKGYYNIR